MKKILCIVFLLGYMISAKSQKVDTTYYDKAWHGVKFKELAQYIRFDFDFKDPNYDNKARIFYIGGQLESEGIPLSNNKFDGTKGKWKGELTRFFPNGSKMLVCNFDNNGALQGKMSVWNEKELLMSEQYYVQDTLQGESLVYDSGNPDICYLTQFEKGKPVNNETIICYRSGKKIKADYLTKKIITSKPLQIDCKNTTKDGIITWYYDMNGIFVSLRISQTFQYGKYYQCFLQFANNTNDPIEIIPNNITGQYVKKGNTKDIELMLAEDYLKKVGRAQAFSQAIDGLSSGMSTYNAGYSTTTTTGSAVGTGGWAMGSATSTSFNPNEKRALMNQEQEKLQKSASSDKQLKESIDGSILKRTVVEPGDQLVKSFLIKYQSSDKLIVNLLINGLVYSFDIYWAK